MNCRRLQRVSALMLGIVCLTVAYAPPPPFELRGARSVVGTTTTEAISDIDFTARITTVERPSNRRLRIEYKITNLTDAPLLVFDQGDTDNPGQDGAVYIEPRADGVVEVSRRGFVTPLGPSPTNVVYPGATLLAAGASASGGFELTLAYLVTRRPYVSLTPGPATPRPVRRVRFCLGVVSAEGVETRTEGRGARRILVPSYTGIVRQRLLCSSVVELP